MNTDEANALADRVLDILCGTSPDATIAVRHSHGFFTMSRPLARQTIAKGLTEGESTPPERQPTAACPYPKTHAPDCQCGGEGGDR
jgi:hypothetical protein